MSQVGIAGLAAKEALSVPRTDLDAVVVGLGYVGLPLVQAAVDAGLYMRGFDVNSAVISSLNSGHSHIDGVSDDDICRMRARGFFATCDESDFGDPRTIVICVATPLDQARCPDLSNVVEATRLIARTLRRGTLVILESTTFPGTTEEVVRPILEESGMRVGQDFNLAFSPERIDPGNRAFGVRNIPKVIGGCTTECAVRASEFYQTFVSEVFIAKGTKEAEMAKMLENVYRQVNIALVNEIAILCHELDIDLWNAIECASTKPFGFVPFQPGPGVGGHCIPVDPCYLSHQAKNRGLESRMIDLAQAINDYMPIYVVERASGILRSRDQELASARVLLLGVTYKADIADRRESPADEIVRQLRKQGADIVYHDPYIDQWAVDQAEVSRTSDLNGSVAEADITIVLQWHAEYRERLDSSKVRLLFDTRGQLFGPGIFRL